jgi:hypothetical protein
MLNPISASGSWLRKQGLILLLLFTLGCTSLLVIQQQRTIEAQRTLIRQLFTDSVELSQLKVKNVAERRR